MRAALVVAVVLAAAAPARADREPDEVNQRIKAHAGKLKACYVRELDRSPSLKTGGKVVVKFSIQKDGKTAQVRIDPKSTLQHKAVSACVVGVFRKIRFATDDTDAHVSYPLLFSAP